MSGELLETNIKMIVNKIGGKQTSSNIISHISGMGDRSSIKVNVNKSNFIGKYGRKIFLVVTIIAILILIYNFYNYYKRKFRN